MLDVIRMGKDGEKHTQANVPFSLWSRAVQALVYSPPRRGKIPLRGKVQEAELCSMQRLWSPVHGSNSKTNSGWGFSPETAPAGKGDRRAVLLQIYPLTSPSSSAPGCGAHTEDSSVSVSLQCQVPAEGTRWAPLHPPGGLGQPLGEFTEWGPPGRGGD